MWYVLFTLDGRYATAFTAHIGDNVQAPIFMDSDVFADIIAGPYSEKKAARNAVHMIFDNEAVAGCFMDKPAYRSFLQEA